MTIGASLAVRAGNHSAHSTGCARVKRSVNLLTVLPLNEMLTLYPHTEERPNNSRFYEVVDSSIAQSIYVSN